MSQVVKAIKFEKAKVDSLGQPVKVVVGALLFTICFALSSAYPDKSVYLAIMTVIFLIDLSVRWKNIQSVVLLFVYMVTHAVMLVIFYGYDVHISFYKAFQNDFYFSHVLRSLSFLIFVIWLFAFPSNSINRKNFGLRQFFTPKPNRVLFFASVSIMTFIIVTGIAGESIFQSGGYGQGKTTRFMNLAIYEYFLIFFLMGFKYMKENLLSKLIMAVLVSLYVVKNLSFGGRIESLQLIIMIFILFLEGKFKYRVLLPLGLLLVVFLGLWGMFRGSVSSDLSILYYLRRFNTLEVFATQSEVIYSSAVIQSLRIDSLYSQEEFLNMLVLFFVSVFVPSRFMPQEAYLTSVARNVSGFGGGGLISSYFYTWLGYFGVVFIGLWIAMLLNGLGRRRSQGFVVYQIMVLSVYPRWFSYSPITMFKLSFYGVIVYFIFRFSEAIFALRKES